MTGEMNGIMEYILEKASTFGGLLEKFFGIGVLDMPPEEILSSPGAMAAVIGYLTALPVVFLLYAGIRQRKRARAGLVMKQKEVSEGVVTAIDWKNTNGQAAGGLQNGRWAIIKYKAGNMFWEFRCPAGEMMKGDSVRVVYEKAKPAKVLTERDYREGWRGHMFELVLAGIGAAAILSLCVLLAMTYLS